MRVEFTLERRWSASAVKSFQKGGLWDSVYAASRGKLWVKYRKYESQESQKEAIEKLSKKSKSFDYRIVDVLIKGKERTKFIGGMDKRLLKKVEEGKE